MGSRDLDMQDVAASKTQVSWSTQGTTEVNPGPTSKLGHTYIYIYIYVYTMVFCGVSY